jgi:hypothetical protein
VTRVVLPGGLWVRLSPPVMPGLVPGIHVFLQRRSKDVDGRDKPGHDDYISLIGLTKLPS